MTSMKFKLNSKREERERSEFVGLVRPGQYRIPLEPGDVAIDCGANVGNITDWFLSQGAEVYAFEPNPHAFAVLKERFLDNPRVVCINKGVAGIKDVGEAKLFLHKKAETNQVKYASGCSILSDKHNVNADDYLSIEIIDLCEFIKNLEKRVKILKIDIEGAEVELINDLIDQGLSNEIGYIIAETHGGKSPSLCEPTKKLVQRIKDENISNIKLDWI